MLLSLFKGFSASVSLIVAIGAQNAFVIRQGMLSRHLFLTAIVSSLIDAILISLGVLGFERFISFSPLTIQIAKYFAVLFLFVYGAFSLKAVFTSKSFSLTNENRNHSIKKTICVLLALALLNPHAYLDTVILLGSIASQQPRYERAYFALGAISASFVWFFGITYGSKLLAPLFCKPICWKILDLLTVLIMWAIAATLLFF